MHIVSVLTYPLIALATISTQDEANAGDTLSQKACYPVNVSRVPKREPEVVHNHIGARSSGIPGEIQLSIVDKRQQFDFSDKSTLDKNIFSPKSASFSDNGKKLYVNSLEGCKTVVYDMPGMKPRTTISYEFPNGNGSKWARPSGFYNFSHYPNGDSRRFAGKPVESDFSHNGKYLWVTFYRRSFDINAQDPSAVALIDAKADTIVRMFETGPLPKMIAVSPDDKWVAVTHWGDNTVGLIDISDKNLTKWHHVKPIEIGKKLSLDFPLDESVNRDANSGNLLRGTVFTPDSKHLLVSAMAGALNIINVKEGKLIAQVMNLYGIRHLAIFGDYLYGSKNSAGEIVKIPLQALIDKAVAAHNAGKRQINAEGVITCKVGSGARTLALSPDGKYIFVACNSASQLCVVDSSSMKVVDSLQIDSYPVGLAISPDGSHLAVTSQGRSGGGGNAVNLIKVDRPNFIYDSPINDPIEEIQTDSIQNDSEIINPQKGSPTYFSNTDRLKSLFSNRWTIGIIVMTIAAIACFLTARGKKKK